MGASYEWIVNPELNEDQVRMRVKAALTAGAAVVVVTPAMLAVAAPMLEGTGVRLAAACDWPFGMAPRPRRSPSSRSAAAAGSSPRSWSRPTACGFARA